MFCFNCGQTMQIQNRHGVVFEHCYGCGSYWFDGGELETVLKASGISLDERLIGASPRLPQSCRWCGETYGPDVSECPDCKRPLGYNCPRDQTPMAIIEEYGIEFDHCTQCRGLWFDGRELKAFTEAARAHQPVDWSDANAHVAEGCQVCGAAAPPSTLLMAGGLLRCIQCRREDSDAEADAAASERIKQEYYRHWRHEARAERRLEGLGDELNEPLRHSWLTGYNHGFLRFFGLFFR